MLHSTKLDFKFWGELLLTAAYTYNVTGHSSIELKTPHEVLFGEAPSLNHLRVIGTSCTYLEENVTFKFNPNGHSAILLGYVPFSKTYKLWDINSQKIVKSGNVQFDDESLVSTNKTTENISTPIPSTLTKSLVPVS